MNTIIHFIQAHQFVAGAFAMWFISAVASALPRPQKATGFYVFLYNFAAIAAASLKELGRNNENVQVKP